LLFVIFVFIKFVDDGLGFGFILLDDAASGGECRTSNR
jgi:hypothetical protein